MKIKIHIFVIYSTFMTTYSYSSLDQIKNDSFLQTLAPRNIEDFFEAPQYATSHYENCDITQISDREIYQIYLEAKRWNIDQLTALTDISDAGHPLAQVCLSDLYAAGRVVKNNKTNAIKLATTALPWIIEKAEAGNPYSQLCYAWLLHAGRGTDKNLYKAAEMYQLAANFGLPSAQNNLGMCYKYGYGVKQDFKLAIKWFEKSARNNFAAGLYNLGVMHASQKGTPLNYTKAFELFQKAADQELEEALFNLGVFYYEGKGVSKDFEKAFECFLKAADLGCDMAHSKLLLLYPSRYSYPNI